MKCLVGICVAAVFLLLAALLMSGCLPTSPTIIRENWCARTATNGQIELYAAPAPCPHDPVQDRQVHP